MVETNPNEAKVFETFLNRHDGGAWSRVIAELLPFIHEVDKAATQIWFSFFPVDLAASLQQAEDRQRLATDLQLLGMYELKDQIDTSHTFLYGHRYWPPVKKAVVEHAASAQARGPLQLASHIREVSGKVSAREGIGESLLVGITGVAFMTLQQAGFEAFCASPGAVHIDKKLVGRPPEAVLRARARDDSQGLFGFLRGEEKIYTITFDENDQNARFKLINTQELTTAAAGDKRDYISREPRCMAGEGPIPVQCRSAACGTCWVGVLGGAEKLSRVDRLESGRIKEFGYIDTDEPRPLIRLSCRAQAFGAVSIVIPPWNGVFGKFLRAWRNETARQGSVAP